jgi:TP901 family phage tail tape measure protein
MALPMGLGGALEFDLVFQAVDNASHVIENIGSLLESVVTTTADFQSQLVTIQNNTTMTSADVATMRAGILKLSADSGAGLDDLGQSFQRIQNVTGNVETAIDILKQGTESAISTGGDLVETNLLLATVMHEYGADVSTASSALQRHADVSATAAHYMGTLHLAAAESRTTLSDFVETGGQAIAWAANLQVPIEDVAAAFATLTLHGFDAAEANTQLRNDFVHIVTPTKAVRDELAALSEQSGVGLVRDFSATGIATKHLTGIMADLMAAFHAVGMTQAQATEEAIRLIPNMRGSAGAFILTGTGAKDYARILGSVSDQQKVNAVTDQSYQRTQATAAQQWAVLGQQFTQLKMTVGEPILQVLQTDLIRLTDWLSTHQNDVRRWAEGVGQGLAGAVALVSLAVPRMFALVETEWEHLKTVVGNVGTFFDTTGTGINVALRSIASGLYDTMHGFMTINEQMFNGVLGIINTIMNKIYQVSESMNIPGGPYGMPPGLNAVPPIDIPTAAQSVRDRAAFLQGMFGAPINPATGRPYAGGGGGGGQQAGTVRGGGGGAYSPDMPGVNLQDAAAVARWQLQHAGNIIQPRGSGGGAGGTYQDAAGAQAALQASLQAARDQFQLDQLPGASQARLLTDIKEILAAMKASGATPAQVSIEGIRDRQALSAAVTQAAQQAAGAALTQARAQFQLDQLRGASQARLMADIATIVRDVRGTGASRVQQDLERAQDLKAIGQDAATKQAQVFALPHVTYQRPDAAGFQNTIASFGMVQRDHLAEMVTLLRQELAASQRRERHDEEVIATLQATLREQRTGTQAATITAGNTTRLVAMNSGAPTPYRDPRGRLGTVHP